MVSINRKLNLVVPVERADGSTAYVHSQPISQEIFEEHFFIIGQVFSAIYAGGFNWHTGPRLAYMLLKKIAIEQSPSDQAVWRYIQGTLIAEMNRLTTVLIPGQAPMLWDDAVKEGVLSPEDVSEVQNAIAFFIVNSFMHKKSQVGEYLASAANLWGAQISSLNATDFLSSLQTSKDKGSSGGKAT